MEHLRPQPRKVDREMANPILISDIAPRFFENYMAQRDPDREITRNKIQEFVTHIDQTYVDQPDRDLVVRALQLSLFCHENNRDTMKRYRRFSKEGRLITPYIEHPLAIASTLAGKSREVVYEEGKEPHLRYGAFQIPVKQDPMRPEIVASALLHDVVEDVEYAYANKHTAKSIKGEEWHDTIEAFLSTPGHDPEKVKKVSDIVRSVTHFERNEVSTQIKQEIRGTDLYASIVNLVLMRSPSLPDAREAKRRETRIKTQVLYTLTDIHKMFLTSFGPDGEKVFDSNEEVRNQAMDLFLSSLLVKCHDIENNLETPGTRDDKLVRAHIYAVMARVFGMPVASRLAAHLIMDNQYSITPTKDAEADRADEYRQVRRRRNELHTVKAYAKTEVEIPTRQLIIESAEGRASIETASNMIPILSADDIVKDSEGIAIQFQCILSQEKMEEVSRILNDEDAVLIDNGVTYIPQRYRTDLYDDLRITGRNVEYAKVYSKNGMLQSILRLRDDQPTAHDLLRYNPDPARVVRPSDIPEANLVRIFHGSFTDTSRLIARLYPNRIQAA